MKSWGYRKKVFPKKCEERRNLDRGVTISQWHEQVGTRPAIILADTKSPVVVVVPLTSNLQALRFPFTLLVSPSRTNGLDTDSVALVLHLRAIDRKRLRSKAGLIEKAISKEIDKVLRRLFMI